jgi:hypothetical protein
VPWSPGTGRTAVIATANTGISSTVCDSSMERSELPWTQRGTAVPMAPAIRHFPRSAEPSWRRWAQSHRSDARRRSGSSASPGPPRPSLLGPASPSRPYKHTRLWPIPSRPRRQVRSVVRAPSRSGTAAHGQRAQQGRTGRRSGGALGHGAAGKDTCGEDTVRVVARSLTSASRVSVTRHSRSAWVSRSTGSPPLPTGATSRSKRQASTAPGESRTA